MIYIRHFYMLMKICQMVHQVFIYILSIFIISHYNKKYLIAGLWGLVHANAWITLGECEWVPLTVVKKSIDINFTSIARLTQVRV